MWWFVVTIFDVKEKLRSQKLLERLGHNIEEKKQKDFLIVQRICALPEFEKAKKILFYMPIHNEVDLTALCELYKKQKSFILPKVQGKTLDLYFIENVDELETGAFGILEPKKHFSHVQCCDVDLVLVPGIVFSRNGHRIGYGKGFYDRILTELPCPKIGIAYDFQMVENISGEMHDVPMDIIVTEKEAIKIS